MNYDSGVSHEYSPLTLDSLLDWQPPLAARAFEPEAAPWTILLPFRNEAAYLGECLQSAAIQTEAFDLILVDNGSTDGSAEIAQTECRRLGLSYRLFSEPRRGKVHALERGLAAVDSGFVATFDADTIYPEHYLESARRLLQRQSCVAAQAFYVRPKWRSWRRSAAALKLRLAMRLLPHQCHNGGAGQVFATDALRRSGGFDSRRWNLILEDHEIIHRLSRLGSVACHDSLWCCPSRRDKDLARNRWSFGERLAYHLTPARFQQRFFYDFLAPRLEARRHMVLAE